MLDRYAHGEGHLGAVLRWLSDPARTPKAKMKSLEASPEPMVAHAAGLMAYMSEARLGANLAALANALNVFADPLVSAHTSRSDLDLTELQFGNLPVSLFLCSPFSDQARLRPLWSCLIEMLIARWSAQGQTPRHRVLLCLDEAMALGRLPELETGMSYLTGAGVQVFMAFQNQRQVKHTYGEFSPILDAIPTSLYYTPEPTDRVTLEEISTALGTTTSVHATRTETRNLWGLFQRETLGEQRHERPLRYPDEIARLSDDACLLLTKGHAPVEALKLDAVPVPVVLDLTKPRLRKVAMVAGLIMMAAGATTWAVWPPATSAPRVSLTTDTTAPTRFLGGSRQTVEIAVAYVNRPDTLTFKDLPATITVAVDGPAGDIGPLTIDLGHSRPGSNYHLLLPTQVPTPPGITVQAFKPAMLVLEADLTVASAEQARMDAIGWGHRLAIQPARQPWEMWKLYQANAGVPSKIEPMPERVGPGFATQEACQRELAEGLPQIPDQAGHTGAEVDRGLHHRRDS